jgi:hypothetical protein
MKTLVLLTGQTRATLQRILSQMSVKPVEGLGNFGMFRPGKVMSVLLHNTI